MLACMHACIPYKSVDRSAESSLPSYGLRTGAPFAALSPPAQPRPPPQGENSSITKGAKKRNPGLKRPAHRSFSGPPLSAARSPPPLSPAQGRAGRRRCEGSCPAPREQSPPRELVAALRAGDKGRQAVPSSKAALGWPGGKEAPKMGGAICTQIFPDFCVSLLCAQRPVGLTQRLSLWSCNLTSLPLLLCPPQSLPSRPAFFSTSLLLPRPLLALRVRFFPLFFSMVKAMITGLLQTSLCSNNILKDLSGYLLAKRGK